MRVRGTIKRAVSYFLIITTAVLNVNFIAPKIEIAASNAQQELQDNINKAVKMIEQSFDDSYNDVLDQIKELVKENGWDYEMTMMSFYDNGNPFKSMDYTRLIAALSTVRELSSYDTSIFGTNMLTDVDYLSYEVEEEEMDDGKKMGNVKLSVQDPEYVFSFFNVNLKGKLGDKDISSIYESRVKAIDSAVYGVDLKQNTFVKTRYDSETSALSDLILQTILSSNLSNERKTLIKTAISLIGQVPYQWGGKASGPGYDNSWWLYLDNGDQKGLDCSGFVQWAFMTSGFSEDITDKLISTSTTVGNFEKISVDELLPGDLGLFNNGSLSSNHVGIYLGDGYWIHCSSSANTVTIAQNVGFNLYVRAIELADGESFIDPTEEHVIQDDEGNEVHYIPEETIEPEETIIEATFTIGNDSEAEDEDVYLLAQLIHHEAGNQGFNGLVAVAEAVMNRVKSALFPDTVEEVVYQEGQFTTRSKLAGTEPSEEELDIARDVIEGKLSILNNENALYFKNPSITDGISANTQKDWGDYKWYMAVGAHAFYLQG